MTWETGERHCTCTWLSGLLAYLCNTSVWCASSLIISCRFTLAGLGLTGRGLVDNSLWLYAFFSDSLGLWLDVDEKRIVCWLLSPLYCVVAAAAGGGEIGEEGETGNFQAVLFWLEAEVELLEGDVHLYQTQRNYFENLLTLPFLHNLYICINSTCILDSTFHQPW